MCIFCHVRVYTHCGVWGGISGGVTDETEGSEISSRLWKAAGCLEQLGDLVGSVSQSWGGSSEEPDKRQWVSVCHNGNWTKTCRQTGSSQHMALR